MPDLERSVVQFPRRFDAPLTKTKIHGGQVKHLPILPDQTVAVVLEDGLADGSFTRFHLSNMKLYQLDGTFIRDVDLEERVYLYSEER